MAVKKRKPEKNGADNANGVDSKKKNQTGGGGGGGGGGSAALPPPSGMTTFILLIQFGAVVAAVIAVYKAYTASLDTLGQRTLTESHDASSNSSSSSYGAVAKSFNDCGASRYLSPRHVVHGFHIMCIKTLADNSGIDVTVFRDGNNQSAPLHMTLPMTAPFAQFGSELEQSLLLNVPGNHPPNKFPWAMFNADGTNRLTDMASVRQAELVFVFKGGQFIWPGVEVGHVQRVEGLQGLGSIEMKTLSMQPLVFEMANFLTADECSHIIERATPHMAPSPVTKMDHDIGKDDTNWRTSTTHFLSSVGDMKLLAIDQRVEDLTRVPQQHQELVQVLRYDLDQRYTAHHDFFDPMLYQKDTDTLESTQHGRLNRMVTVFWYLSTVEEGGETIFPLAGGNDGYVDPSDCTKGLKVKPVEGKVAVFYSLRPDGQFDDYSLHGACPVIKGRKWAANKWVWSGATRFSEH